MSKKNLQEKSRKILSKNYCRCLVKETRVKLLKSCPGMFREISEATLGKLLKNLRKESRDELWEQTREKMFLRNH